MTAPRRLLMELNDPHRALPRRFGLGPRRGPATGRKHAVKITAPGQGATKRLLGAPAPIRLRRFLALTGKCALLFPSGCRRFRGNVPFHRLVRFRGNVPFHRLVRFRAVAFGPLPLVACVLTTPKNSSPIGHDGDYGILDVNIRPTVYWGSESLRIRSRADLV